MPDGKALDLIGSGTIAELRNAARIDGRRRKHANVHSSYADPCQRLFNALYCDSYIRPHCHQASGTSETLMAISGLFGIVLFNNTGCVADCAMFGAEDHWRPDQVGPGVVIAPGQWHTVLALTPAAVLFEVKAGPFDPDQAKDLAPWAPAEGSADAPRYLRGLQAIFPPVGRQAQLAW